MDLISNLAENYPKTDECLEMDIVLEGGAANGSYHIGCLLYIKLLEKKNILKINRISGSSIGTVAGLYYLTDTLEDCIEVYKKLRESFKKDLNASILKSILEEKINKLTDEDINNLNDKLFIVYHDISQRKQVMINKFTEKKELLSSLLKSCHIPFLSQNSLFYIDDEKEYIDGGVPYIFSEREIGEKKILYIEICKYGKLNGMFCVKKEKNNCGRLLEGALDAHEFFLYKKPSKFCSFVNNWGMKDYVLLRFKQLIFKFMVYCIILFNLIGKKCFPYLPDIYIIQFFSPIFFNFYRDFLLFYCL